MVRPLIGDCKDEFRALRSWFGARVPCRPPPSARGPVPGPSTIARPPSSWCAEVLPGPVLLQHG